MPKSTIVSQRNLSVHKEHELLGRLEAAGLGDDEAQAVIESKDNLLAQKVVAFIRRGGRGFNIEETESQKRARAVMGQNFFGIAEAIQHFGIKPTEEELAALAQVPFTKEVLEECKDTHILIAVFPLSILDLRERVKCGLFRSHEDARYNDQSFAKKPGQVGWHLVCKKPVADSIDKTWDEQQALLGEDEQIPSARVMVQTIIGHYLTTGQRLFENIYVRCSCVDSRGYRVYLGAFDSRGLRVDSYLYVARNSDLGLSSSRKF